MLDSPLNQDNSHRRSQSALRSQLPPKSQASHRSPSVRKLCMVILNSSGSKMCKGSFTVISVKKKDVNGDKS